MPCVSFCREQYRTAGFTHPLLATLFIAGKMFDRCIACEQGQLCAARLAGSAIRLRACSLCAARKAASLPCTTLYFGFSSTNNGGFCFESLLVSSK